MKKIFMFSLLLLTTETFKQAQALPTGYQPSIKDPIGLLKFAWNVGMWHYKCTSSLNKKDKKKDVSEKQTTQEEAITKPSTEKKEVEQLPEEILSPQVEEEETTETKEEPLVEEEETQQLPPEVIFNIMSFMQNESKKFTVLEKDFHSKMFDENGNPKSRFLRAASGVNSWKDSYSVKIEKLFLFLFNSEIVPTLDNIKKIIGERLVLPSDDYEITKESLVELALNNNLKSEKAFKAAIRFLRLKNSRYQETINQLFCISAKRNFRFFKFILSHAALRGALTNISINKAFIILARNGNVRSIKNMIAYRCLRRELTADTVNKTYIYASRKKHKAIVRLISMYEDLKNMITLETINMIL